MTDESEQHAYVVGVDLSDSWVNAAVIDDSGHVLVRSLARVDVGEHPSDLLGKTVAKAVEDAVERSGRTPTVLGLSMPGTLRPEEGLCLLSPRLGWEDVPVVEILEKALPLRAVVVNDIRSILAGERAYGAGRSVENFVCVSMGSVVDGGIMLNGRVYEGASDCAGEIGHLTIEQEGSECACGNQGCLDTLVSGPAVARMVCEAIRLGAQSVMSEWASEEMPLTSEMVCRAAREGDALALKVWDKVGRYLGLGLAAVVTIVNPRRIIIGGRLAQAFDFFAPTLREEVRRRARMVPRDYTEIVPSPLGLDAALLGCGVVALRAQLTATSGSLRET